MYFYIIILIVFSWCRHCVIAEECVKDKSTAISRLKEELFCNYDKTTRPKLDRSSATDVSVVMGVTSLLYDMHSRQIIIDSRFNLTWNDDHLVWKQSEHDGIEKININTDDIWMPDLSHYNRASEGESPSALTAELYCLLSYTGRVECQISSELNALCSPVMEHFPYDTQNCTLRLGSWIYSGEEINFTLEDIWLAYFASAEWDVIDHNGTKHLGHYDCCPNKTYPSLIYYFVLRRYPGMHICSSIVPLFAMTLMTLLALFHDPEDKSRFTMILINIVAHFLYLQYFYWQLPLSGPDVPLILLFCRDSLFLTTFILILTTFQKHLITSKGHSPVWISKTVEIIINSKPAEYIFISGSYPMNVANRLGEEDGEIIIGKSERQYNKDNFIFCNILDRLCIFSYCIVYIVMTVKFT